MKILAPSEDASSAGRRRLPNLASAPSSPAKGEEYFDTTTNKARIYNGTSWEDVPGGGKGFAFFMGG